MNDVTRPEAVAVAEGEDKEKKHDAPVLRSYGSHELVLWNTRGEKFPLRGVVRLDRFEGMHVLGKIGVNPRTSVTYVEIVVVDCVTYEGQGESAKYKSLGFGHAINTKADEGETQPVKPEDGGRRMIFTLGSKDDEKKIFTCFITKWMDPELFAKLGFTGEMTTNCDVARAEAQVAIETLRTALENERRECNRAWREVDAIASAHKVHARWRAELADKLHDAETELLKLRKVAVAFKILRDNAEEKECDGRGLWAQHGWWEAVDEAIYGRSTGGGRQ